ncbi:hypothetical protein PPERSA_07398 [Pseudocohnilembus persalinus]|uniref:Uncharacterized protein n=1 Tax=Pseudocohnilembus persalinus TaxID=266149 RepID=A0A0V0QA95_PSEPJ|nr:hypothetical protein PPERSA_07398 [Pseudocohnilembus persalinus]|eukprot:KRW99155.1 hypothetical protein PPERSA_07398 [Pseudocohnilembus persalinus]
MKDKMGSQQGSINKFNNEVEKKLQFQHKQIFQGKERKQNYDNSQYNYNDYDQIFLKNQNNPQQQKWEQFQNKLDNLLKQSATNLEKSCHKESLKSSNGFFDNQQNYQNIKQSQNLQFQKQKYLNEEIFAKQNVQQYNDKQYNKNDTQIKEDISNKSVKLSQSIQMLQQKYSQNSNSNTQEDYKDQYNNKLQNKYKQSQMPLNQSCQIQVQEQIDYTNLNKKQVTSRKTSCLLDKKDEKFSCGYQNFENISNYQKNNQHQKQYTFSNNLLSKSKASPKLIHKAKNINLLSNIQENNGLNLKDINKKNNSERIPCFFIPYKGGSNKILLYFHGNSEDLGTCNDQMNLIVQQLKVNILAMEYPSYGVYKGAKPNEEHVLNDAEILYEYLVYGLNIEQKNIIVMGRSLGTGPTIHLSSKYNPSSCILVSPFTSIRGVVKNYIVGGMLKYLINERFNNEQKMKAIQCPICFIHGIKDEEIPYQQSLNLIEKCQNIQYLYLQDNMTHKQFDMVTNILDPIKNFMLKCDIQIEQGQQYVDIFKELQSQKDEQVCQKQQLLFQLKNLNKNVLKIQA